MTNKEIAKAWFAAIDANNFEAVKKLMHSQHSFRNPMTPTPVGQDEHIGMMQMMTSAFEGGHDLELILTDAEYVTVTGRYKGKHIAEFNGLPATNKNVDFTFIDVFQIEDGKVRNEFFEMNPMSIMMQIGAAPANA